MTLDPAATRQSPQGVSISPHNELDSRLGQPAEKLELLKASLHRSFPVPESHRFDDLLAAIHNAEQTADESRDQKTNVA